MTGSDVVIREAQASDVVPATALLARQLAEHEIALAPDALADGVRGLLEAPQRGRMLVAGAGAEVAGVAVLSFLWTLEHGGRAAWLDELYVAPAHRRRGLGGRLAEAAVQVALAAGCRALDLEVEPGHEAAERLYERLGFRRHRRTRWVRPLAGAGTPLGAHRPFASLDHVSLGVNDLARSTTFYDAALAPLGLVRHEQIPGEAAYGPPDEDVQEGFAFYIGFEDPAARRRVDPSAGLHVAFRAPTREAVRRFHAAALAHGGRDNGAPGLRPQYHPDYYGAFVLDPDGHHVEAVCHAAEEP